MKILSWNCRGIGNPRAERALSRLIFKQDPDLVFLMETRKKKGEMQVVGRKIGYKQMIAVDCREGKQRGGGIALLWKETINIDLISYSMNHVLAILKEDGHIPVYVTGFYGHPEEHNKCKSWELLRTIHEVARGPWVCFGDFNAIVSNSEKKGWRGV